MQTSNARICFGSDYCELKDLEFTNHRACGDSNIIIYKIHLSDYVHIVKELTFFLEAHEKDKALKYYKLADKNRFIICRSLMKFTLAYHTQSHIKDVYIGELSNKKPYLPAHPNLFFNLSHSGDYAVLAISTSSVGIDIEFIDLNHSFKEALSSVFNEDDIYFINNAKHRIKAFYNLWTRKEAFVKALGKGIDDDFHRIPSRDGLHNLDASIIGSSQSWQITDFEIDDKHTGAVAYEETSPDSKKILVYILPNKIKDLMALSYNKV